MTNKIKEQLIQDKKLFESVLDFQKVAPLTVVEVSGDETWFLSMPTKVAHAYIQIMKKLKSPNYDYEASISSEKSAHKVKAFPFDVPEKYWDRILNLDLTVDLEFAEIVPSYAYAWGQGY